MSSYYVLRDCFVGSRFYGAGKIYDLPDSLDISPKNFKAVDEAMVPITQVEPVKTTQQAPAPQKDEPVVMVEKTFAVQLPVTVPSVTTTNAEGLDWDNAEVYVSDKDKAKPKKNKKK